jgi:hypothetical protein
MYISQHLVFFSAALQARARIAEETRYRELAERSSALQAQTQATLAVIQAELAQVATSVAAAETILKQVE